MIVAMISYKYHENFILNRCLVIILVLHSTSTVSDDDEDAKLAGGQDEMCWVAHRMEAAHCQPEYHRNDRISRNSRLPVVLRDDEHGELSQVIRQSRGEAVCRMHTIKDFCPCYHCRLSQVRYDRRWVLSTVKSSKISYLKVHDLSS
jgi:hypothetical protein